MPTPATSQPEPPGPIERGHFDEAMADAAARDIYERGAIIFASDFTKAKGRRWSSPDGAEVRLQSSAASMKLAAWCIHGFLGRDLEAFPCVRTIALRMNCSERTAREAFGDLVLIGAASCVDSKPGIASRRYALNYGIILREFVSEPGKALQSLLATPAESAGVSDTPADSAGPPGEICRGVRQILQAPPAKSAAVNTPSKGSPSEPMNHGGSKARFAGGGAWGSNRERASTDDFEAHRQRTIDTLHDAGWRAKARAWALQAGVSRSQAQKRIAGLSEDRFIEILHIIDDRKRAALQDPEAQSVSVPGLFVWLCQHPEVRRDNYAKRGKRDRSAA